MIRYLHYSTTEINVEDLQWLLEGAEDTVCRFRDFARLRPQ